MIIFPQVQSIELTSGKKIQNLVAGISERKKACTVFAYDAGIL